MTGERAYDIVLFGATGFVGELTAEYLVQHAPPGLRWALAGRNKDKLAALRERLGAGTADVLVADAADRAGLDEVARQARVVVTTVGPYQKYGEPLVAACAEAGTDYLDLTGEPEFIDEMYLRHHQRATETGARLIHAAGFDSIPHDLGAYFTVQQLPEDVPLTVRGFVRAKATFSGGTYHSALTGFSRARQTVSAAARRKKAEPRPAGRQVHGSTTPLRHKDPDGWAVPLPTIDPQIVLRSARALDRYGPEFTYGHYALVKRLPVVIGGVGALGALFVLAQIPPLRNLLGRFRKPGEGPSPQQRAKSWFTITFVGTGGGKRAVTQVKGGDPGYGETAKMLAESALSLTYDELPKLAGQVTTAQAFGNTLIDRLTAAGITFTVLS